MDKFHAKFGFEVQQMRGPDKSYVSSRESESSDGVLEGEAKNFTRKQFQAVLPLSPCQTEQGWTRHLQDGGEDDLMGDSI